MITGIISDGASSGISGLVSPRRGRFASLRSNNRGKSELIPPGAIRIDSIQRAKPVIKPLERIRVINPGRRLGGRRDKEVAAAEQVINDDLGK